MRDLKPFAALLLAGLISAGASACGTGAHRAGFTRQSTKAKPASVPWWLRYRPLSLAQTERLIKEPYLPVGAIREDGRIFAAYYGYLADAPDTRAVTAAVKRYYAVASRGDGRRACSMLAPSVVKAVVVNYGTFGSRYLRSAHSCQTLASRMFAHAHSELSVPIEVNGVLRRGTRGFAVIDSPKMAATIVSLVREGGAWRVSAPLGGVIPRDK